MRKYLDELFSELIKKVQEEMGSRANYAKMAERASNDGKLSERESEFLSLRDSFYIASVTEEGWPYVQHRGGPIGFVEVADSSTLLIPDYSGNRQYVTVGNTRVNDRVSLIFVDYPNRARLKIMGHLSQEDKDSIKQKHPDYKVNVERYFKVKVVGYDWNCPQHITPRYTVEQIEAIQKMRQEDQV
ncbi:MAG: pyridoxamine 5'-phosphate oxidase family protein [Bdellovibrionales bacterium]|nr:pyridoxamine 5'-phosphate oxidase family protein [Bdellovibrionales bacterium]